MYWDIMSEPKNGPFPDVDSRIGQLAERVNLVETKIHHFEADLRVLVEDAKDTRERREEIMGLLSRMDLRLEGMADNLEEVEVLVDMADGLAKAFAASRRKATRRKD